MALRNIFKKKKKPELSIAETPEGKKEKEKIKLVGEFKEKIAAVPKKERKIVSGEAYRVLKSPHITEKATDLAKKNQYVFKISKTANKTEIKKTIENLYGVDVLTVRIIKIPKKLRKLGKRRGWKKGYKKAIVKIKAGQEIEVLPR